VTEPPSSRDRQRIVRLAILVALLVVVTAGALLLRSRANSGGDELDLSGLPAAARPGARALAHGDFATAADELAKLPPDQQTVDTLVMLGVARGKLDQTDQALKVLKSAGMRAPKDPRPLYWSAYFSYRAEKIDEEQLLGVVNILRGEYGADGAPLADQLEKLMDDPHPARE